MKRARDRQTGLLATALLTGLALGAGAAVVTTETFDSDPSWVDRDAGEMTVSFTGSFGNPAGALQGSFAAQGAPQPQVDAFRVTDAGSGGNFTGDYHTGAPGFTSWSFDFYAGDVLPSGLLVRFGSGTNIYQRSVLASVTAVDTWTTLSVPLTSASGWFFPTTDAAFSNALNDVDFIDIEVSRSGTGAQTYYLDNFALNASSAVPEPGSSLLFAGGFALLQAFRRRVQPSKEC